MDRPSPHYRDINKPPAVALNLVKLIKQLIVEGQYDGVALLFSSAAEAKRNLDCLKVIAGDVLHDVCLEQLNDVNYEQNMPLYNCAEELLLLLAASGPPEDVLLELLEMVEDQKSDNVFTSALKALQMVLLRLLEQRPRALEWGLNSIQNRLVHLPIPSYLSEGYDLKQLRLLEQDVQVLRVLMNYITVGLFYDPLHDKIKELKSQDEIFRFNQIDCRNVLCCFLVQLLGRPLALLDICTEKTQQQTNSYTAQCAYNITKSVTDCLVDPLYLLSYVEKRVRWQPRLDSGKGVYEMSSHDIFMIEEKLPMVGLAIYYYMVLVEGVTQEQIPKIYAPLYILESGLYLVAELLNQAESALHYRGLLLGKRLLVQLQQQLIPAVQLELTVHKTFCHELCNIIGYSPQIHLRQEGLQLLRSYILQFDDEGKYLILKNLLRSIGHTGIAGYLAVLYKDLVANALRPKTGETAEMPSFFSGVDFRTIFLQNICCLPNGAETDLIEQADKLIASLNAVRYFALTDLNNRTGFWSFTDEIDKQFLSPLRRGLDMSVAHYRNELELVEKNEVSDKTCQQLKMLDMNIVNERPTKVDDKTIKPEIDFKLSRKQKTDMLNQHLCALDLMRSLLARATECVEGSARNCCENKNLKSVFNMETK